LGSLSDGATSDASSSYSKSPLIKEETIVGLRRRKLSQTKEMAANETIARRAEGKSIAKEIVRKATSSSIKNISEHYVHGVLGPHRASTKHCKDQVGREEEISVVDCIGCV
jgi:hypothetical protein